MAETELKPFVEKGVENIAIAVEQGGANVAKAAVTHVENEGEKLIEQLEGESPTLGSKIRKKFNSSLKSVDEFLSRPIERRASITKMDKFHNLLVKIIPKTRNRRIAALLISLATLIAGLTTIIKLTEHYTVKPKHKYAIKNGKLVKRYSNY